MTDLIVGIIVIVLAVLGGGVWGDRRANRRHAVKEARRETETLKRATEARDAVDHLDDDAVLDRVRKRSRK